MITNPVVDEYVGIGAPVQTRSCHLFQGLLWQPCGIFGMKYKTLTSPEYPSYTSQFSSFWKGRLPENEHNKIWPRCSKYLISPDIQHGPLGFVQWLIEKIWSSIRYRRGRPWGSIIIINISSSILGNRYRCFKKKSMSWRNWNKW